MDLLERFKALWQVSFKADVPIEILSRLEACVDGDSTKVEKLTRAYQETKQCIESLHNKLNQEELVQNFLQNVLKEINLPVSVSSSNTDYLYAKVNKSRASNEHTDSYKRDSQIIIPSSSEYDDIDGAYSEIRFERQEDKVAQTSEKKICSGRGSVKDKVRQFELIEKVQLYSSSSDSSGEDEQERNQQNVVSRNPQSQRWRRHINSYEEIAEVNPSLTLKKQDSNVSDRQSVVGKKDVNFIKTQDISKFQGDDVLNHRSSQTNCSSTKQFSSVADKSIDIHSSPLIARSCTRSTDVRTTPEFNSKSKGLVKEDTELTFVLESYAGEVLDSNYKPDQRKLYPSLEKVDNEDSWYSDVKHVDNNFCTENGKKQFVTAVQVTNTSETDTLKIQHGLNESNVMLESDLNDIGTQYDNMHLFRKHSGVEDNSVVGKRFKSLSSSGSDDEKSFNTAGIITRENLNSLPVKTPERIRKMALPIRKIKPHASIPDYENWSLNAVLTLPGISLAEQEFHLDTGSEEDLEDGVLLDKFETESKHSTDSGVCEDGMSRGENGEKIESLSDSNLLEEGQTMTNHRLSTASTTSQESVFLNDGNAGKSSFTPGSIPSINLSVPEEEGEGESNQCGDLEHEDTGSISSLEETKDKEILEKESFSERTKKLYTRNLVLKGILESDRTYVSILDELLKAKIFLQTHAQKSNSIIDPSHVTTMFYKLDEIHSKHKDFVQGLEKEIGISGDEQRIGNSFKLMASHFLNKAVLQCPHIFNHEFF
ncbi:hypothetical protein CHS0354_041484 [Potamilus streckersoni]|uniref:DH domain-containing protein n=1 Tax=Potamilus streckersoni TaxID=2493646 RepID=A0AAE0WAK6_9BIVA|nr:hypothetical protein CHS0354_041484 [Potamilus streckersoni]